MNRIFAKYTLVALAMMMAGVASAAETRLELKPELWQKKLFNTGGAPEGEAAVLKIVPDGLAVGPWHAGDYSARLEYRKPLPVVRGMVLGRYRTENLYPRQAAVTLQFFAGKRSLVKRTIELAAAPKETDFSVPIARPPAGADAVTVAFGLAEHTEGSVHFSELRVSDEYVAPQYTDKPELTRPRPPQGLAPGAAVRIERAGDAWWLVDPAGKPFFSLGSVLPWAKNKSKSYEVEARVLEQMQKLGLNSTAGSHDVYRWAEFNKDQAKAGRPTVMQFYTFETRVNDGYDTLVDAAGRNPGAQQDQAAAVGAFNHAFPDPFDPRWEAALRKRVRDRAAVVRGKPWFGGWMADNERAHENIHRYVWSKHCAAELGKFLEGKYKTIDTLNKAWGSGYASFEELLAKKPDPLRRSGAMYEDFRLFSREIIRKFNETALNVIRAEDPGRLVLSNRFMLGETRDLLDNIDLYKDYDAIAVNIYPANNTAGLDVLERQLLNEIHKRTGKPILITEWSVPALDSGLYDNPERKDWSYSQAVETQAERARQAAQIQADLYNMPFVIGTHWFAWNDFDSEKRQANRGLFKAGGQPWTELQEALGRVNLEIGRR